MNDSYQLSMVRVQCRNEQALAWGKDEMNLGHYRFTLRATWTAEPLVIG